MANQTDAPPSEATAEDKEVADLVHRGLLKGDCGADVQLSDLMRSEPAYVIRYTTRKRSAKERRTEEASCWEDELSIIDEGEIWEQDWEMVRSARRGHGRITFQGPGHS